MDIITEIKEKLPENCIYKIALIASVFAGKNNYCRHVLLAEKIRPIIFELRYAHAYLHNKVDNTKYDSSTCKKIYTNIGLLYELFFIKIKPFLERLQYEDDAFFIFEDRSLSQLYYPLRRNESKDKIGVFRGYHSENGYFDKSYRLQHIANRKLAYEQINILSFSAKYNIRDIQETKLLLDRMISGIESIKTVFGMCYQKKTKK